MYECIFRNCPGNPQWQGSFYEQLTEYGIWNKDEFWELHLDLTNAARAASGSQSVDRELAEAVALLGIRILGLIGAHFSEHDVYKITNVGPDELHDFKERVELAVLGVFSGEIVPESSFYFPNPLICE